MKQKGEEQNKNQINKLNKNKINHVYEYSKDWTAHDFYGKYHLNQIKNQIPIPGTQIKLEQEHKEKKLIDIKRFENERELKKIETQKLMDLKKQTSEVKLSFYLLFYYYLLLFFLFYYYYLLVYNKSTCSYINW